MVRGVVERIPDAPRVILATGPLTAPALARDLREMLGDEYLYFYDAISPIVYADSIDHDDRVPRVALRRRRGRLPEPGALRGAVLRLRRRAARRRDRAAAPLRGVALLRGLPADRGDGAPRTADARLRTDEARRNPRSAHAARVRYAVVQLRQEDKRGVLYNLVGFQTKLRVGEQQRILRTLPGLSGAVFARYGSVHRNTYVNAPKCLLAHARAAPATGLPAGGPDRGGRGLRRVGGARRARRDLRRLRRARGGAAAARRGDRPRRPAALPRDRRPAPFPADERQLRPVPAAARRRRRGCASARRTSASRPARSRRSSRSRAGRRAPCA